MPAAIRSDPEFHSCGNRVEQGPRHPSHRTHPPRARTRRAVSAAGVSRNRGTPVQQRNARSSIGLPRACLVPVEEPGETVAVYAQLYAPVSLWQMISPGSSSAPVCRQVRGPRAGGADDVVEATQPAAASLSTHPRPLRRPRRPCGHEMSQHLAALRVDPEHPRHAVEPRARRRASNSCTAGVHGPVGVDHRPAHRVVGEPHTARTARQMLHPPRLSRAARDPPLARSMTAASTPELEADRQALIALIKDEAVFHGDFTLSSGKKATYYVDMRKLTLDHRAAPAIGRIMLDLVRDVDGVVAVGGLTLGADPIANAVMHESARTDAPLDAFVVRKEPKDHGRGRQVEGADVAGKRVVVLEDTSTTASRRSRRSRPCDARAPSPSRSRSSSTGRPARRPRSRRRVSHGSRRSTSTTSVSARSSCRVSAFRLLAALVAQRPRAMVVESRAARPQPRHDQRT